MTGIKHEQNQLSPVKRALLEIRELRSKLEASERAKSEPIAIIGMGCRIPGGANDVASFWRLLDNGVDAIVDIPSDRWDADAFYDPDPDAPGKMSTRWGGFLDEIDKFDPDFFGISPREAVTMDPQQRLLLEVAWESLENAGQAPDKLFRSETGVFIGIGGFDYWQLQMQNGDRSNIDAYFATGITHSVAAGRLSYVLGLQGPSVAVDTACSSSLVAIHQACHSLRAGECHLALAGGVNLILTPEHHINFSKAHVLASDGRCKAFDAFADGFVRSEGCGIVVLKRLSDALADNDSILAIVRGSAVNQDGRSSGLTAPNGPSQQEVIRKALANAGIEPALVQYVEAHGTGTSLGDPIEVQALAVVFGKDRPKTDPLFIGSVKTNIGHLETAAGVTGLIKLVLALQYEKIPPHLHLKELNPHISWEEIPVKVPVNGISWPAGEKKRFAGVSSFGFSGTNAHIVLEEAPSREIVPSAIDRPLHLLTLSALSRKALGKQVLRLADHLGANPGAHLPDVAYSANTGRSHFDMRMAVIAETTEQVLENLAAHTEGKETPNVLCGNEAGGVRREVAFLFTGQGSQRVGMGRDLFETQPVFRNAMERCDKLLRPYLKKSLLSVLYPEASADSPLDETAYTQPALFALEYALAELWRSWGIEPGAVIGHSVGEYVAACVAGVFNLEDGIRLIAERARLMQTLPSEGMMAVVFAPADRVRAAVLPYKTSVDISAINSPNETVISGESRAIRDVLSRLEKEGIRTHPLRVSHAFYSSMMEPMLASFETVAREVTFGAPRIPLVSNVTGEILGQDSVPGADYWRRHAREPVRFDSGIQTLYDQGYRLFLELGPNPTLLGLGRQCVPEEGARWFPSLRKDLGDWESILESLGGLYVCGVGIDWEGFDRAYSRRKVMLPTYPFQRERYWVELPESEPEEKGGEDPSLLWEKAVACGLRQSLQTPIDLDLHTYPTKWQCLDRLTTSYVTCTLRELGVYAKRGEAHGVADLLESLHILPTYEGLLSRWLERLTREDLLEQQGNTFMCRKPLPDPELDSRLKESRQALEDIPFLQQYVERCGGMLIPVLTGKESPLETLFPGGSSETGENIYQHWALSRYFNQITASIAESFAKHTPNSRQVRILEVGAGTGGTTSSVLPILPPVRTLYYYTDVSEVFFNQAERKFKAYPFVRYTALDIEKDPREQGYGTHGFDIVIAANVLHATRNLQRTLQNVLSLLAPDGFLVLYEVTDPHSWFDVTVALIEGWQRFDDDLRSDGPLLTLPQWEELLKSQGFSEVVAFPESGSASEILKAHVVTAKAPSAEKHNRNAIAGDFPEALKSEAKSSESEDEDGQRRKAFLSRLDEATPDECRELLVDYVRGNVIKVLRRDASKGLDHNRRLMDVGIDSLMAVELRNLLGAGLELERALPATLIFDYPTIEAVAKYIAKEALGFGKWAGESSEELEKDSEKTRAAASRIEEFSEEEVEKMVLDKLDDMEKKI